jgi:AraC-like DNA-binding protein
VVIAANTIDIAALRRAGDAGYVAPKLHATVLAADEGLRLHHVHCACGESDYEARDVTPAPLFVFVEHGAFRRRTQDADVLVDVGFGYFAIPGCDEEFAHPNDGGDVCSSITMTRQLVAEITGGELALPERPVPIDAEAYRCLRRLVDDARRRGGEAWVEHGINLFGGLIRANGVRSVAIRRPATRQAHRRLVDNARDALVADPSLGVTDLARMVGCSPYHLSRVFSRETGTTISAHRIRLRVREAVARVSAGEANLARLASELGFSDHSHLTRLLVRELGETPTALRARERRRAAGAV